VTHAVIFDVDGTLVDSNWHHTLAWWQACHQHGVEATAQRLHGLVGMGGDEFLQALVGEVRPELKAAHDREMDRWNPDVQPLRGARELILALHGLGTPMAVASSGDAAAVRQLLGKVLDDVSIIGTLVTSDDVDSTKPAPDLVAVAVERLGLPPEQVVMVGDTGWDAIAAQRCGVRCVAVLTGGWCEADLRDAGAIEVYPDLAALLDGLQSSPLSAA
jgi:HAD superfamily hydrolase (TIGR01509 family)